MDLLTLFVILCFIELLAIFIVMLNLSHNVRILVDNSNKNVNRILIALRRK